MHTYANVYARHVRAVHTEVLDSTLLLWETTN